MRKLILNSPSRVGQWVSEQQGKIWAGSVGAGIGLEEDGHLIAGVFYDNWNRSSIHIHIAADPGKRNWITRENVRLVFGYPFKQLKCTKVLSMVGEKNLAVQRLQKHLGYRLEATLEAAHPDGALLIYTLVKEDLPKWVFR